MESYYSNCIFFAVRMYLKHGGYIAIRKSRMGCWIPHFIWIADLKDAQIEHFVPVPSDTRRLKIPPPYFEGYIKTED